MSTSEVADLDGDGALDVIVPEPEPTQCNNEYTFALCLRRGSCGHRVGTIQGALQIDRHAAAQRETETITYRFDGARYRERSREVTRAACRRCSRVSCHNTRIQRAP